MATKFRGGLDPWGVTPLSRFSREDKASSLYPLLLNTELIFPLISLADPICILIFVLENCLCSFPGTLSHLSFEGLESNQPH